MFLGYAGRHGRALIDRALYLPKEWAGDAERRRQARIPADILFTTKPKQGLAMLERARAAGVPFAWVTGDSVYGTDHAIRRWAERHRRGYVMAVTSGQRLGLRLGLRPVTTWIEDLSEGLLWARGGRTPARPTAALRWSAWRRRHQQRARRAHWHRRTQEHNAQPRL